MRCLRPTRPQSRPKAFMLTEVLVAAMVLAAVISVATQLAVRSGRVRLDSRQQQVALDELSNQLDRLTALDDNDRQRALENLAVSPFAAGSLAHPELSAEVLDDADGRRVVLSLVWNRFGERLPVTLVGWLPAPTAVPQGVSE